MGNYNENGLLFDESLRLGFDEFLRGCKSTKSGRRHEFPKGGNFEIGC